MATQTFLPGSDAHALGAADFLQRGRRPRLALHHFREQCQPDADDLAVLGQACNGLLEKLLPVPWSDRRSFGQCAKRPAKRGQHLLGMREIEQIDQPPCSALEQVDFQVAHEPADRHPEIVAHHDNALHPARRRIAAGPAPVPCFPLPCLACSHCSNWSRTISTFLPTGVASPRRMMARVSLRRSPSPPTPLPEGEGEQARDTVSASHSRAAFRCRRRWPRRKRPTHCPPAAASRPAFTSDDLPHPDGP